MFSIIGFIFFRDDFLVAVDEEVKCKFNYLLLHTNLYEHTYNFVIDDY